MCHSFLKYLFSDNMHQSHCSTHFYKQIEKSFTGSSFKEPCAVEIISESILPWNFYLNVENSQKSHGTRSDLQEEHDMILMLHLQNDFRTEEQHVGEHCHDAV